MRNQDFQEFSQVLDEPCFLLNQEKAILSANTAAAHIVEVGNRTDLTGRPISELVTAPDKVHAYLTASSRSPSPIPGALSFQMASDAVVDLRCDAARVSSDDGDFNILLRCRPRPLASARFILLNEKIAELSREIHQREKTEEALRKSEEQFRILVESNPSGIAIFGVDGRVVLVNEQMEKMFGYGRDELTSLPGESLVTGPSVRRVRERIDHVALSPVRPKGGEIEVEGLRKGGATFPLELHLSPLETSEGQAVLVVARDLTERRKEETEEKRFEEKIQHAQKLESLGVLAGGIAHDFNNLLMGMLGNADMARMEAEPESIVHEYLEEVVKSAQRAADLCNQMLAYSGKGKFVVQAVNVSEIVKDIARLLEVSISKKAALRLELAKEDRPIEVDVTQLRQIVMNLITNASDAIGDRQGVITLATGAMNCSEPYLSQSYLDDDLTEGEYAFVEVTDTGRGIEYEKIPHIFDPFYTTKEVGRGLGLAAVLGIVRSHGGALNVYSEPGKGTTFKVLFPVTDKEPVPIETETVEDAAWHGSGTVLVIDDEPLVLSLARRILTNSGFTTMDAKNGREGLACYIEHQSDIVAVLLDMTMPVMDGAETFRELRNVNPNVRVILSSGYNEQEATNEFTGKGLAGFLQKPYLPIDLINMLKRIIPSAEQ